ncbi:hypothetical protein PR048_016268 [Dryococelus australis]|uniref:PiggyBac transposable element-derived protein domain-containing protein n=1 Tax=Dryococelus australis TaxID=614101 RepID=A0ABQ9HJ97_9NEOP|nr:hypothetical protein PR048_016268 [Dryococelus australis]
MLCKNCESFDTNIALLGDQEWDVGNREFFTPLDYFEQYIPDDFYELISDQSNRRHMQENPIKQLKSTPVEYEQVVGAHIVMGCLRLPRPETYYRYGLKVASITQLPRDRLFTLRNYLHLLDNFSYRRRKESNRLWKVQPIYDVVRNRCKQISLSSELSINEQMILFTGKTKLKQYVKGKPNPVGPK